jgi:hypothetical protein
MAGRLMLKVVYCLRRLPELTHDQFLNCWHDVHAPLVRNHQRVLRIARYVQFDSDLGPLTQKPRGFRGSPAPYDGIAEIWYDSREALETLGRDPAARAASLLLFEDEQRFVDSPRSPIWCGDERTVISGKQCDAS